MIGETWSRFHIAEALQLVHSPLVHISPVSFFFLPFRLHSSPSPSSSMSGKKRRKEEPDSDSGSNLAAEFDFPMDSDSWAADIR